MAIIRKKELREMAPAALQGKLADVEGELYRELGLVKGGGRAQNPGRIRELKRTIARIKTLMAKKAKETKPASAKKAAAVEVKKSA